MGKKLQKSYVESSPPFISLSLISSSKKFDFWVPSKSVFPYGFVLLMRLTHTLLNICLHQHGACFPHLIGHMAIDIQK